MHVTSALTMHPPHTVFALDGAKDKRINVTELTAGAGAPSKRLGVKSVT